MPFRADSPKFALGLVLVSLVGSLAILWWVGVPFSRMRDRLRERFIWGIPWGSLICVAGLFAVYLFVQRGYWHWNSPVIVAYTASSMFDAVGWVFAGFAHTSPGHFRSNLTSLLVFAPIVEWAWGHYPSSDRAAWEPDWLRNPRVRAAVVFPLAVGVVTVIATLFSWGPVIGFSIGVWALMGFALVHYPVLTIIALVARTAVRVLWATLTDPVVISQTTVRAVRPSWFGTAVQGHLVGLLFGVVIGIAFLRYLDRRPDPATLWLSSVLLGMFLSLWALWWILGPEVFILFRAVGVALVFVVATLITLGAISRGQVKLVPPIDPQRTAIVVIVISIVAMGGLATGLNLVTVESPDRPVAVSVEDYDIYYGENLPDGMVNLIELEAFGLTTDVQTSGVIVVSEERGVWFQSISATELETRGHRSFHVGGLGWSEEVTAVRQGWVPVDNSSVYQVWIGQPGAFNHAFASDSKRAKPVVEDHRFSIEASDGRFYVSVEHLGEAETVPVPANNESVRVHGVEIVRSDDLLYAESNGTSVPIAAREVPPS